MFKKEGVLILENREMKRRASVSGLEPSTAQAVTTCRHLARNLVFG